jgi:MYND finger
MYFESRGLTFPKLKRTQQANKVHGDLHCKAMPACGNCGGSLKLKCAGCKIVYFCDRACQLEENKPHCRKTAANAPVQDLSRKDVVKQLSLP